MNDTRRLLVVWLALMALTGLTGIAGIGMILTAIVIAMGIAAFVLALTYRSFRLTTEEEVGNDPEDTRVSRLSDEEASWIDEDAPVHAPHRDTDEPDELDALPGHEGSR